MLRSLKNTFTNIKSMAEKSGLVTSVAKCMEASRWCWATRFSIKIQGLSVNTKVVTRNSTSHQFLSVIFEWEFKTQILMRNLILTIFRLRMKFSWRIANNAENRTTWCTCIDIPKSFTVVFEESIAWCQNVLNSIWDEITCEVNLISKNQIYNWLSFYYRSH